MPGVTTRTTSRGTMPFTFDGSAICSQIATLKPCSRRRCTYALAAWWGTPAIGISSSAPLLRAVRVRSRARAAVTASSKKSS